MGISIHKRAIIDVVHQIATEKREECECLLDYLQKLYAGFFAQDYVNSILQKWEMFPYDLCDAYTFCRVHTLILSGSVAVARVYVGMTPHGDKEVEYRNSVLRRIKNSHFSGKFWGGVGDSDGYYAWEKPLEFDVQYGSLTDDEIITTNITVDASQVPLEVGYTDGATTLKHLLFEGGLARWPYESEHIWLYMLIDKNELMCNRIAQKLYSA